MITLKDGSDLFDSYREGAHVRYSDYYPNLCLDSRNIGGALLTHDHRITSTLDLPLVYIIPLSPLSQGIQQNPTTNSNDKPDWSN